MAYVSVSIDPDEFSDDELIDELESRGFSIVSDSDSTSIDDDLSEIYLLRRCGLNYDHLMDAYIYKVLGKIV